jgi:hypothetical protein
MAALRLSYARSCSAIEHRVDENLAHTRQQLRDLLEEHAARGLALRIVDHVLVEQQAARLGTLARLEPLHVGALP